MVTTRFRSPEQAAAFSAAYEAVLAQWPVPVEPVDVVSPYGTTRVNVCGPAGATPLILLPGGGSTSAVWFANVGELSRTHRVYAVDLLGDVGRSVPAGTPIRTPADLMAWLDALFDGLGIERAHVAAHSYGGWIALSYAVHAPSRVGRLALLDPSSCFAGMRAGYLLRGVPALIRPSANRMRSLIRWETAGAAIDPAWLALLATGAADFPRTRLVLPRRPDAVRLRALTVPTLLLLAERSRSHDVRRVGEAARRLLPDVTVEILPGATHHTIPTEHAADLNDRLVRFFG